MHSMATNKNAILRFNTLDKCFSNLGRKYFFNDLLDKVNAALSEQDAETSGIKTRQLREDLRFMRSEVGYGAPIITVSEGRKQYYRYEESTFSINNSPINATEAAQLNSVLQLLKRFDGAPGFEWVSELSPLLKSQLGLNHGNATVISYESNIDYSGYDKISPLFNAIVNKQVLTVDYEPFGKSAFSLTFHPYYLKQYNGRWFAFGLNQEYEIDTWNLALDRIIQIENSDSKYQPSSKDWEDYFYDFIGVTRPEGEPVEVRLMFRNDLAPYISTKPLHPSQKSKLMEDGFLEIRLKLIPNYELETLILSFGEKVKVIAPKNLKRVIEKRLKEAGIQY